MKGKKKKRIRLLRRAIKRAVGGLDHYITDRMRDGEVLLTVRDILIKAHDDDVKEHYKRKE